MIKRGEKRKRKREKPILCFTMIKQFVCYWDIVSFYQQYLINITFCIFKNKISDILNRINSKFKILFEFNIFWGWKLCIVSNTSDSIQVWYFENNVLIFWKYYSLYLQFWYCIESNWINSNSIQFENVWQCVNTMLLFSKYYYFQKLFF